MEIASSTITPLRTALAAALLTAAVSLSGAAPAQAFDASLCADDGVSEVPPFAKGRDSNGCLVVDPGNGDPDIKFQYENFHKRGIARHADRPHNSNVEWIDLNAYQWGHCRSKDSGSLCNYLMWDVVLDSYLDPGAKNEDGMKIHYWGTKNYWIKDSMIINNVHCKGGSWVGPNGIRCASGESSGAHVDGIQAREVPNQGGWLVFQDSAIVNVMNSAVLIQGQPRNGVAGGIMFQGFRFEQTNDRIGEAVNWIEDCKAMGKDPDICDGSDNGFQIGTQAQEIWFVNVWGNMLWRSLGTSNNKIVVVNQGCGKNGCNGTIGYDNGWPHPMEDGASGPGTCPNGRLTSNFKGKGVSLYCYTSLENALSDGHDEPPFARHSATGWADPPEGVGARPKPVQLLD